jgi:endonuclease-8
VPEGDTIYKIAEYLDDALRLQPVRSVSLHAAFGASRADACRVTRVWSEGKHLLVAFDDGVQLRSHLGMYGAWHSYPRGARWRKPRRQASVIIATETRDFVCFNAKEVQWLRGRSFLRSDQHARLGADLIRDGLDADDLLRRVGSVATGETLLVDLLLDQRVAAGIGNVYKSELLFLEGVAPATPLAALDDAALVALYRRGVDLLSENLGGGARTTRFEADGRGRLWVYGRRDLPCLCCGATVRRALLGTRPRSTYWCDVCQR